MQPPARLAFAGARRIASAVIATAAAPKPTAAARLVHCTASKSAVVSPVKGNGPPPAAPIATDPAFREDNANADTTESESNSPKRNPPAANDAESTRSSAEDARVIHKRRRQEIIIQAARDVKAAGLKSLAELQRAKRLRKRFWKEVHVREVDGLWEVHLDTRPLRHPTTKEIVRVPATKPQLAYALANEWDQIESVQQASKQHMVPLTSLICRALDIGADDAAHKAAAGDNSSSSVAPVRASAVATAMRYLDTDGLLCWAPPDDYGAAAGETTLRQLEERARAPPSWGHPRGSRLGPGGAGLDAFDLAGVERAALAGKSVLVAARLVARWSETGLETKTRQEGEKEAEDEFGVEEATAAVSVEVRWQTGRWGEVEDTHDVEKEDLRRQFGSVVLLVSGKAPGS
ncbi:ATP12 chaperone [Magnaporthiopsis poae ATCC 64411]|uniref:ATP12 chaperone n=1 Tax=Magnaporthiopsis poae (strain ATCC 64411 / 73-15) TaxID=644358 RepID=A0A0C4DQQ5_MAGP6|nr:ATP12 chaperone [Magnaporthiopsis poae ATCC 64411]